MAVDRSFKDYVAKKFDNDFWTAAETYLERNRDTIEQRFYKLHKVGEIEIADVVTEWVWVYDRPEMQIQFDVVLGVTLQATEGDYHYDDYEEKKIKLMVRCQGDLNCSLEDFEIFEVKEFDGRNTTQNPLDDSLVPYISKEQMEAAAKDFLKRNVYLLYPMYRREENEEIFPIAESDYDIFGVTINIHFLRMPFIFEEENEEKTKQQLIEVIKSVFEI